MPVDKEARLAQLVRAPRLHRGGPGFESLSVHPAPVVQWIELRTSKPDM